MIVPDNVLHDAMVPGVLHQQNSKCGRRNAEIAGTVHRVGASHGIGAMRTKGEVAVGNQETVSITGT